MRRYLAKLASPQAWKRVGLRLARRWYGEWQRRRVNSLYGKLGPVAAGAGPVAVIADGLWDNPNHFFRLRLFLEALPDIGSMRLIGILHKADDCTRPALERLGFTKFVTIEDHPTHRTEDLLPQARAMLDGVKSHKDLLALSLPGGLPAYTYYDTVLKLARHPQPALDDPLWERALAECLRNCLIYQDLLENVPIAHVMLSHPWQSEFATLVWAALSRGIPTYHLTGYCEGIRIRRFLSTDDYAIPVEQLNLREFLALPEAVRRKLAQEGADYLAQRQAGEGSDINTRYAFHPASRAASRAQARRALGVSDDRKLGVIYSHVWFDFPHTFAMVNFTDFLDWMRLTLEQVREIRDMDWVLKPHPTEEWYGGFRLRDLVDDLPPHLRLAPSDTDSLAATIAADVVVTVHGTVGLEAAAHGLPVIASDRSFYGDWGFVHQATSRDDYVRLLRRARDLPAPDETGRQRALALIALALAPTPADVGGLRMRCDSSGPILYKDIIRRYSESAPVLERERTHILKWLGNKSSSYAAHVKTDHFLSAAGDPCP